MAEILDGTASGSRGFLFLFLFPIHALICLPEQPITAKFFSLMNHCQFYMVDWPKRRQKGPSMQPTVQDTLHRLVTLTTLSPILTALEQVRSREATSHNPQDSSQPQL